MGHLAVILLCMALAVTMSHFQREKMERAPLGPLMCAELCKHCYQCRETHYKYNREQLLCKLTEGDDSIEEFIPKDTRALTEDLRTSCAVSRTNEDGKPPTFHARFTKICGVTSFMVSSVSKSAVCPNLMYFLHIRKNKRSLISMDMETKRLVPIYCFKKDDGSRQIFIGSCFRNQTQSCLYKLKVTTVLEIISYKEHCEDDIPLEVGVSVRIKNYAGQAACFVGKTNTFICLIRGKLFTITPGLGKVIALPWRRESRYYLSSWIRDIAVAADFSYVVVVYNKMVSLSALDYANKSLVTKNVFDVNVQTVTRKNSLFMFHGGEFDTPFAFCSIIDLLNGPCESKILNTYPYS